MSKVLVDRELLERLQEKLDPHRDAVLWGEVCNALRRAQPAEAEGVKRWALDVDCLYPSEEGEWCEYSDHLAALSAVTAERDRLQEEVTELDALRDKLSGLLSQTAIALRVDLEDFGGNVDAAVDALLDGDTPAMAAKEA